jgi:hypothetical protein
MADNEKETDVTVDQFKRNLDHLRIDPDGGPEITLGDITLTFKTKAPVKALSTLIGNPNQVEAMIGYLQLCLVKGQDEALDTLMGEISVEGLGEILNFLNEAYTSFPATS